MPHTTRGPRPLGAIHSGSQHHGKVQRNTMPSQITDQQWLGVGRRDIALFSNNILAFPHATLPWLSLFFFFPSPPPNLLSSGVSQRRGWAPTCTLTYALSFLDFARLLRAVHRPAWWPLTSLNPSVTGCIIRVRLASAALFSGSLDARRLPQDCETQRAALRN